MSQPMTGSNVSKLYFIPVNRFATSELPHFKQKFSDHRQALSKLEAKCDWQGVHQEQFRASATLRKLQQSLQDLENVKSRLETNQQSSFEQLFLPVREDTQKAIDDFAKFLKHIESAAAEAAAAAVPDTEAVSAETAGQQLLQRQLVLNEQELLEHRRDQLAAYESLERDASDLHEIFADLATMTAEQREQVAQVEENVSTAQVNVSEGARHLAAAARLSGGVAPVAGALLGGLVAGPLGLMVGAKVGSVAAVGGGVIGYFGGQMVNTGRRGGGGGGDDEPSPVDPPPTSTQLEPPSGVSGPVRLPEQPVDPLLAEDVEEAEEAETAPLPATR
ncbi:syntaxin-17-like isoform X2 [Amphibalanus amphitrite]|uniref:syntaxin-17-like isoform X2 n=1 Tax=Amphibalanus amphitrite TaxID=1232801 RepID=UPI001C90BA0E|nr:syntaxin-17-like isoform X2 [Amphibalanus amphitrite]XP_043236655.1 syntaxin-17-like isoform X2 [Amphibalanus amphitrite]